MINVLIALVMIAIFALGLRRALAQAQPPKPKK
jgi:hypothetical protein